MEFTINRHWLMTPAWYFLLAGVCLFLNRGTLNSRGGVIMLYLWVGVAGAFGSILRYSIGIIFFTHNIFPYTTLIVNLLGSFLLAWLTTDLFKRISISPMAASAIGTGFVGSFTTFSTLSVETVTMFKNGDLLLGIVYVIVSIVGGLLMGRLGFKGGRKKVETI